MDGVVDLLFVEARGRHKDIPMGDSCPTSSEAPVLIDKSSKLPSVVPGNHDTDLHTRKDLIC